MKGLDKLKCNIVIVEDDDMTLNFYKKALSSKMTSANIKGFNYISDEFYEYIKNNHIDLFVLDVVLGIDQNGIDLTNELLKTMKGLTFLFVSGFDYTIESFKQFNGKCIYDYASKPLGIDELVIRANALVNISKSYNRVIKNEDNLIHIQKSIGEMRDEYFEQIKKDRLMIKKLKDDIYNREKK